MTAAADFSSNFPQGQNVISRALVSGTVLPRYRSATESAFTEAKSKAEDEKESGQWGGSLGGTYRQSAPWAGLFLLVVGGALCALSQPASAQLTGYTLTAEWWYPTQGAAIESHDVVVDSSVELDADTIMDDFKYEVDIGDDYVEFRFNTSAYWQNTSFNGYPSRGRYPKNRGYPDRDSTYGCEPLEKLCVDGQAGR